MPAQKVVELDYAPRIQFMPFHERTQRWACMVCHRRAGKTVAVLNDQIKKAITIGKPDARLGYIAPYRGQAKEVAWSYLKKFSQPLWGADPSESDLKVTLLNGAIIRLYGGDNPDAIRGGYFDDVVMDEFGDQRPSLWRDVVRPMLADRNGSATFIGTPKGKNEFHDISETARKDPANYYHMILPASVSGILPQSELDAMLLAMGTDRYMQELECSWEAAIHGAFYGEQLREMAEEGRICHIPIEKSTVVHTGWDLGRRDSSAIWFMQCVGTERRLIDYYETSGVTLDHYASVILEKRRSMVNPKGYIYGNHYLPHDIRVKEMIAQDSRKVTLERLLGADVTVVEDHNPLDGINAVRRMLDTTYIDPERCARGLEALRGYRREYDEHLKDWKSSALHSWESHGADALRYLVVGHDEPDLPRQEDRHRRNYNAPQSAWGV
jgi:phage terminase large subunit